MFDVLRVLWSVQNTTFGTHDFLSSEKRPWAVHDAAIWLCVSLQPAGYKVLQLLPSFSRSTYPSATFLYKKWRSPAMSVLSKTNPTRAYVVRRLLFQLTSLCCSRECRTPKSKTVDIMSHCTSAIRLWILLRWAAFKNCQWKGQMECERSKKPQTNNAWWRLSGPEVVYKYP